MAYFGRGGFSSIGGGNLAGGLVHKNGNDASGNNNGRRYYRGGLFRMYYYIPLDNTYVIFQMIAAIIIFTVAGICFVTIYKPSVIDPLENTKKLILNTYIIINLFLIVVTLLSNYFSKNKNALIKRLIVILLMSIITMLVFFGIKLNLDSTYNKSKFEQIYTEENVENTSDNKSKLNIGLKGLQIKTDKEYYIDECIKAYNVFSIRMYGIVAINVLLTILLVYQIPKVSQIQEKRDQLSKDDEILFDEEENVKF